MLALRGFDRRLDARIYVLHRLHRFGAAQNVADAADIARHPQSDAVLGEVVGELVEHLYSRDVDEGDVRGVQHDRACSRALGRRLDVIPHPVGIGEEEPALDAENHDPGQGFSVRQAADVGVVIGAGGLGELGDAGAGGPVQQQRQRDGDADEEEEEDE